MLKNWKVFSSQILEFVTIIPFSFPNIPKFYSLQAYNANQLADWSLFFISSNYIAFEKRAEFPQLTGENRKHVEENRWPPVSYLEELEQYNKKYGSKSNEQCVVMWTVLRWEPFLLPKKSLLCPEFSWWTGKEGRIRPLTWWTWCYRVNNLR